MTEAHVAFPPVPADALWMVLADGTFVTYARNAGMACAYGTSPTLRSRKVERVAVRCGHCLTPLVSQPEPLIGPDERLCGDCTRKADWNDHAAEPFMGSLGSRP